MLRSCCSYNLIGTSGQASKCVQFRVDIFSGIILPDFAYFKNLENNQFKIEIYTVFFFEYSTYNFSIWKLLSESSIAGIKKSAF
jgi:hypothetical protein